MVDARSALAGRQLAREASGQLSRQDRCRGRPRQAGSLGHRPSRAPATGGVRRLPARQARHATGEVLTYTVHILSVELSTSPGVTRHATPYPGLVRTTYHRTLSHLHIPSSLPGTNCVGVSVSCHNYIPFSLLGRAFGSLVTQSSMPAETRGSGRAVGAPRPVGGPQSRRHPSKSELHCVM